MRATEAVLRAAFGTIVVGLVVALLPATAEAKPRNPSDGEITAAQQDRARKASEVGRLTGLVAKADGDMRRASDRAELAVERYNKAVVDLGAAAARARRARAGAAAAERAVTGARKRFATFARGSYMQGSTLDSAAVLVDASGPTDLLQRASLLAYTARGRLDALGQLDRAKVRRANADSAARQALAAQQQATRLADAAQVEAAREVADTRARLAELHAQRAALAGQLESARIRLNGLLAERAHYRAWQRAQELAAAKERARLRQLREEAARRQAAAAAAAARASQRSGGAGGSSWAGESGGGGGGSAGGRWTAAKGQRAADAALRWVGTPYAWGGGNGSGPTYGVDGPGAGWNDGSVVGFDCSGLAAWAWAQVGIYLPHYSGYQYGMGRHVSVGQLLPGDLVFWAYDTADPSTIHHVAIYLGGGRVVQAPQSGDVVQVSWMWFDGYIGATRPGT